MDNDFGIGIITGFFFKLADRSDLQDIHRIDIENSGYTSVDD